MKRQVHMIYISTILDTCFGYMYSSYKIEEEIDGIYNAVLNSAMACIINCRRCMLSIVLLLLLLLMMMVVVVVCAIVFIFVVVVVILIHPLLM